MSEIRIYGKWGGNPTGTTEDETRCIEPVFDNLRRVSLQCLRKRGHGHDGLYCKQHDPEIVAKKYEERQRKYDQETKRRYTIPNAQQRIGAIAIAYFDQKATHDDLEKAVMEYRKLIA